jgi:serine/threonine protein kinase
MVLNIVRGEYPEPPQELFTPELRALLRAMLARDPGGRPTAEEVLSSAAVRPQVVGCVTHKTALNRPLTPPCIYRAVHGTYTSARKNTPSDLRCMFSRMQIDLGGTVAATTTLISTMRHSPVQ